jgi:hypothetical protein
MSEPASSATLIRFPVRDSTPRSLIEGIGRALEFEAGG